MKKLAAELNGKYGRYIGQKRHFYNLLITLDFFMCMLNYFTETDRPSYSEFARYSICDFINCDCFLLTSLSSVTCDHYVYLCRPFNTSRPKRLRYKNIV